MLSRVRLFVIPWTLAHQASLSFTISQSLLRLMSIESMKPSNHLILCHLLLFLPSIFPNIRIFSNEPTLHIRWPKDRSMSFRIRFSNEYSRLISFRIDWFDFLAIQGTLKHPHHNLKASVLQCSAFSMVLFLYPYMTTGKTIALIIQIFVGKVVSLLFNMLSIGLKFKVFCTCILTFLIKMTVKLPGLYISYFRALRHSSEARLLSTLRGCSANHSPISANTFWRHLQGLWERGAIMINTWFCFRKQIIIPVYSGQWFPTLKLRFCCSLNVTETDLKYT